MDFLERMPCCPQDRFCLRVETTCQQDCQQIVPCRRGRFAVFRSGRVRAPVSCPKTMPDVNEILMVPAVFLTFRKETFPRRPGLVPARFVPCKRVAGTVSPIRTSNKAHTERKRGRPRLALPAAPICPDRSARTARRPAFRLRPPDERRPNPDRRERTLSGTRRRFVQVTIPRPGSGSNPMSQFLCPVSRLPSPDSM